MSSSFFFKTHSGLGRRGEGQGIALATALAAVGATIFRRKMVGPCRPLRLVAPPGIIGRLEIDFSPRQQRQGGLDARTAASPAEA